MDLYDLFGYTQEERRLAERGLKPDRKKGTKSKRRKPVQPSLFPMPADGQRVTAEKEMKRQEAEARKRLLPSAPKRYGRWRKSSVKRRAECRKAGTKSQYPCTESPKALPPQPKTMTRRMPFTAVWTGNTNPPINGFYEMMMSLTPERRAELRRMGKEKMDANAAKQTTGLSETKKEKVQARETEQSLVRAPGLIR